VAQPVSYDIELGEAYSQQVEAQVGLYDDEALNAYVARVGRSLVDQLGKQPFTYTFQVLDSEQSNAFALPGGPTYVTRGLLALVNDESELAGVMAHEIIHVHERHAIQQMGGNGFLEGLLRLPGQVVGVFNSSLGSLLQVPVDLGSVVFEANYSRSHEKEADKYGIQLAQAAGYDPYALADILDNLSKETVFLSGSKEKRSLTNDHPVTEKRLKYLAKDLRKLGVTRSVAAIGNVEPIDGMIFGQNPAQGVFDDNAFMHPDLMLFMNTPAGWETTNTPATVGAMQPDGEAFVMISMADQSITPKQYGDTVAAMFKKRPEFVKENAPVTINGYEGHAVTLKATLDRDPLYLRLIWVYFDDLVLELSAYGLLSHSQEMSSSLESMRALSDDERSGVKVKRIRFVESLEGETLEDISERTDNVIREDVLALLNGVAQSHRFENGTRVKVVIESVY